MTQIWAHSRSGRITAANTLEAFRQAVLDGADGLELDVRPTADGHLVCVHDASVPLPDGTRAQVHELSLAQLQVLDVGDDSTGAATMPLLDDVYKLLAPTPLLLNVEAKNRPTPYPGFAEMLTASIAGSPMAERIIVSSFDHRLLDELRRADSAVSVAPLSADGLIAPWRYLREAGFEQVHPEFAEVADPGMLRGYLDAGLTVRPWIVNDPGRLRYLIEAGVHGVITDHPARARRLRDVSKSPLDARRG